MTKLNATGTALIYSTYLGGSNTDEAFGIAVDGSGNAYVAGYTYSTNFPTTAGAFQTSYSGESATFVTKLNATGTALIYSTYLGGDNADEPYGIAVDASGNAYVTGFSQSANFPTTAGALQTSYSGGSTVDAFVAKFSFSDNTAATVWASVGGSPVSTVIYGTPVTLTATVAPAGGTSVSNLGSVDFREGNIDLGTVSTGTVSGSNAVFTLIAAPNQLQVLQSNTITATYSPGGTLDPSTWLLSGGLTVTPAQLTITATTNTKTYDGTTTAAAIPTVAGLIGTDTITGLAETYHPGIYDNHRAPGAAAY